MRKFHFVVARADGASEDRFVEVRTEHRARELAQRTLRDAPEHIAVQVFEDATHLFSVGQSSA